MDLTNLAVLSRLGGSPGGGGPAAIPTAQRANLGMPSLNTTAITDSAGASNTLANTTTVFDYVGRFYSVMRIVFGKKNGAGNWIYPTLPVTDDGSAGSGFLKLITFPKGVVAMHPCRANLPVSISVDGNWTVTTPVMALGSAQAGTDAVLSGTDADIMTAVTLKDLTYSSNVPTVGSAVDGAKTAAVTAIYTGATPGTIPGLVNNSGGTTGLTLATGTVAVAVGTILTIVTGATVTPNTQDAIANLHTLVEILRARVQGMTNTRFDGTGTALSVYLNFGVNSNPDGAQTIALGYIASGSETIRPSGYIDIVYTYLGGDSTALFDILPPYHGEGGG